jgi:hypothetical protein
MKNYFLNRAEEVDYISVCNGCGKKKEQGEYLVCRVCCEGINKVLPWVKVRTSGGFIDLSTISNSDAYHRGSSHWKARMDRISEIEEAMNNFNEELFSK